MRILCTETDPGLAGAAVDRLRAAGHEVVTCFDPALGAWGPCVGLDRGTCPLDEPGGVDVLLDVRAPGRPRPAPGEAGVTCALRHGVPLATAGPAWPNPFARWVTAAAHGDVDVDVAEACAQAADHRLVELGDMVSIAACQVLGAGRRPGVEVHTDVRQDGGELHVTVHRPPQDAALDASVAVHAHGALRAAGVAAVAISLGCAD